MNGLGIVLEETESLPLRARASRASLDAAKPEQSPFEATEALLPPLPAADAETEVLAPTTRPVLGLSASTGHVGGLITSPSLASLARAASSVSLVAGQPESLYIAPELYDLDSLALSFASAPITFPSIDPIVLKQSLQQSTASTSTSPTGGSTSTSPLRRLKSLKNGIRKLSFLRMCSQTSVPSLPSPGLADSFPRPALSPIQTDIYPNDASLLSSVDDSLRSSTFGSSVLPPNSASQLGGTGSHTAVTTPVGPTHTHKSSQGLNNSRTARRRTVSQSNSMHLTTPSLPLPIVTLSENLASTRKNLVSIDQNFFDNWSSVSSSNFDSPHQLQFLLQHQQLQQQLQPRLDPALESLIDTISILETSDDLVEYSIYLSRHKESIELAFEVSKDRLIDSGWCSGHDIENLNLQRDSALSQIDSKLLQVEERLNSEFNVSILNNTDFHPTTIKSKCAAREALSPSLKDLESRCLSFAAEHRNIC